MSESRYGYDPQLDADRTQGYDGRWNDAVPLHTRNRADNGHYLFAVTKVKLLTEPIP